jgi:DNA-directed RNA polymerase specialized sigma24 family protein
MVGNTERPFSEADDSVDVDGFDRLLEALQRVRPKLARICASFRFFDEADDLIQQVSLLAMRKQRAIREMEGWLIGAVWRFCVRAAQHRKRDQERWVPLDSRSVNREIIEQTTLSRLQIEHLRRTLRPRDWELLWSIFVTRLSFWEIGESLGCSVRSIGAMKRRALQRAKTCLTRGEPRGSSKRDTRQRRAERSLQKRNAMEARDQAIRGLQALGLTCKELVRLDLSDLRMESLELVCTSSQKVVSLPDSVAPLLQAWCELRGLEPGPLFVRRKKGRLTERGLKTALSRRFPLDSPGECPLPKPRELWAARNRLMVLLHQQGLDIWSLTRLQIEDVRDTGLIVDGSLRPLTTELMAGLGDWISLQGRLQGPLFTTKYKRGMKDPREIRKILKRQGVVCGRSRRGKTSGNPSWHLQEQRDRLLAALFQAGLGPSAQSRLRVEDVRESGIVVKGALRSLPGEVMVELQAWISKLERSSGPIMVSPFGNKKGAMSAARISQILKNQKPAAKQDPACRLWESIPRELQRRPPGSPEEIALISKLVREACAGGVELAKALRLSGLTFGDYSAWEEANAVREATAPRSEVYVAQRK